MLGQLRPLLRIAKALEDIAASLTYFARQDARANNQMFSTSKPTKLQIDKSELMHSDPAQIARARAEEMELVLQQGYAALEELDGRPD